MTLAEAVEMLRTQYEIAKSNKFVKKPLAYALYQVWKKADKERKEK